MGLMDASTTCVPHGGSRNKSAHGGELVGAACHRGTPLLLCFVTSYTILYLTFGLSVEYCHSFINHYFLSSFRPSKYLSGEPYLQHSRTPPF